MQKTIGQICVMLEMKTYVASYKVIEDRKYDTWMEVFFKVDIWVQALMLSRGKGPKSDKVSLRRMNM